MIQNDLMPIFLKFLKVNKIYNRSYLNDEDFTKNLLSIGGNIRHNSFYESFNLYGLYFSKYLRLDYYYVKFSNKYLAKKFISSISKILINGEHLKCNERLLKNSDIIMHDLIQYVNSAKFISYLDYINHAKRLLTNHIGIVFTTSELFIELDKY